MERTNIEQKLASAIDVESATGIGWLSGATMAPIALRRWCSYSRRHPKHKEPTTEDQILDLAKGMQAHFEPGIPRTPLSEWLYLAEILSRVLDNDHRDLPGTATDKRR